MVTIKQVNKALAAKGYKAELVRGDGYFYFWGPDTAKFEESGVYGGVTRLSDLTVERWVEMFEEKREQALDK